MPTDTSTAAGRLEALDDWVKGKTGLDERELQLLAWYLFSLMGLTYLLGYEGVLAQAVGAVSLLGAAALFVYTLAREDGVGA